MPTKNATVLRINHFPPETEAIRNMSVEESRKAFAALGNEQAATFGKGGRHPRMHRTETIDYAIVLAGEITMLLDDEDVVLKAGDILVQCGTNHAWSNRSKRTGGGGVCLDRWGVRAGAEGEVSDAGH